MEKDGKLEWVGKIPWTHDKCLQAKLTTEKCFYRAYRDLGFKSKELEDLVSIQKDRRYLCLLCRTPVGKALPKFFGVPSDVDQF